MRPRHALCVLAGALASALPALASEPSHQPTSSAPVAAPTAGAWDGSDLWATVNLCDPTTRPGSVGVRASIPPRVRGAAQWLRIRIEYLSSTDGAWRPVRSGGDSGWDRVGTGRETVETGYTFAFREPSAGHRLMLRGRVNYEWRRGLKVLSRTTRRTQPGYVDPADEQRADSRAACEIVR